MEQYERLRESLSGLRTGQVYRKFIAKNGKEVTLRAIKWEDLDGVLEFINKLVEERDIEPDIGIVVDRKQTREQEAEWLANRLAEIEKGDTISAVAEVDGRIVANSEVMRGRFGDTRHHARLGISVTREYRDLGIGTEMMRTLLEESRKIGLKTIELEVFTNNKRAIHVYEKVRFREVGRIPNKIYRNGQFFDITIMAAQL